MKKFAVALLSVFFLSSSFAEVPQCQNHRWKSSKFLLVTGGERCNKRMITCSAIGTRSEGWYSYPKKYARKLGASDCAADFMENYRPTCDNIGTKGEGWQMAGSLVQWSKCEGEEAVCANLGTKDEGWYSFPKGSGRLVTRIKCSEELESLFASRNY